MPNVVLASTSPRRKRLLAEHGIRAEAVHPGVDDAQLVPGRVGGAQWAAALAHLKAASAARRRLRGEHRDPKADLGGTDRAEHRDPKADLGGTVVLGADTVVVKDGEFIGQPRDAADAEAILRRLENGEHEVVTGVCLMDPATGRRDIFVDRARVRVGHVGQERIRRYVESGEWAGKAGAYNLAERLAEGWPIEYRGDPTTIMGLPMSILPGRLRWFAGGCRGLAGDEARV